MSAEDNAPTVALPNAHVYEYLNYYIDFPHPPHYVVLLDGPWGIGKTHLIKKFLEDKFREDVDNLWKTKKSRLAKIFQRNRSKADRANFTYVSLFGLKSISEIDEALYISAHPIMSSKGAKIVGRLAKAWLKYKHVEADLGIKDFFSKKTNGLFIFDDLERCEMNVNEVLGYINEFVEHDNCKVVIIANEEEIKNTEYLRRREKIIGKTLRVASSFEEALDHFMGQVDGDNVRAFLVGKKSEIEAVYILSGLNNLRILQQTIWDFQRLYNTLTDIHQRNDGATTACMRLFFPLSFEFKSGRIIDADLNNRPTKIMEAFRRQSQDKTPPTRFEEAQERYTGCDLSDALLSDEVLEDILANGVVFQSQIRECLNKSSYFAMAESEPAWRTVWYITERSDGDFKSALREMERQFCAREFEVIGEMFHVFGIRLWLSSIGILVESKLRVVEECKLYIDDLYQHGRLRPKPESHSPYDYIEGYGGLGVYESSTAEFKGLTEYLHQRQLQVAEQKLPEEAADILQIVAEDSDEFYKQVGVPPLHSNNYYNSPVLAAIDVEEFVEVVLKLHPLRQRRVFLILNSRYGHGHLVRNLSPEIDWIRGVKESLERRATKEDVVGKYRLSKLIEWFIEPILKDVENET